MDDLERLISLMTRLGSAHSARFSPDGSRIAFISNLTGSPQVWIIPAQGGFPEQVTRLDQPCIQLSWSPDGEWLSVAVLPDSNGKQRTYLVRPDSTGLRDLDESERENRWGGLKRHTWHLNSGEGLPLTPDEQPGSFFTAISGADGRTVYLSSNAGRDRTAFGRMTLNGEGRPGPIEILAERSDAELQDLCITPDNRSAALFWNAAGYTELEFFDLEQRGLIPVPPLPTEVALQPAFSPDGHHLVFTGVGADTTTDLWLLDRLASQYNRLTRSPHVGVDLTRFVRPTLIRFPAHDGLELSGWLYRPRGSSGPGPVVLAFHGVPQGQERPHLNVNYQGLLAQGIAVLAPNVRGSAGFGKRFAGLDDGPLRSDGIRDIKSCADHLVAASVADPKRIGIMGGSFGGYMTMASLTEYPDLFAAGASLYGIVNLETFVAHTNPRMADVVRSEYGDPATEANLLRSLSPIHRIDRVKAPTIFLHGARDTDCPIGEVEQVVQTLRRRGVPVEYLPFPDEGHGWSRQESRIRSAVAVVRWFVRHLKG